KHREVTPSHIALSHSLPKCCARPASNPPFPFSSKPCPIANNMPVPTGCWKYHQPRTTMTKPRNYQGDASHRQADRAPEERPKKEEKLLPLERCTRGSQ